MARPKRENADYHSHDKDMRNDKKIKALRKKFSHEGYSIYNMMLEVLDDCDHFQHSWDDINIELLSGDFDIDSDRLKEIIDYAVKIGLFKISDGFVYSSGHKNRFKPLLSKRKRTDNTASGEFPGVSAVENPHSIVKYNKVEDIKEKIVSKVNVPTDKIIPKEKELGKAAVAAPPSDGVVKKNTGKGRQLPETVQTVLNYMTEKMKGKWPGPRISHAANKFFNHYSANGWMQNKGKPIVSWQHAANLWIYNENEGTYSNYPSVNASVPGSAVASKTPPPPPLPEISPEKKEQFARDYIQDCYVDFCIGDNMVKGLLGGLYDRLVKDGLLVLTDGEKQQIKEKANGDTVESRRIAVVEYFEKLKDQQVKQVYEPVS